MAGRTGRVIIASTATAVAVVAAVVVFVLSRPAPAGTGPVAPVDTPSRTATEPAVLSGEGVTWHLSAKTGAWTGTRPPMTLVIHGNRLNGTSGCGDLSASLLRDGSRWTVGDVTVVNPFPCPSTVSERMARYLDLLSKTDRAEIGPTTMRLASPAGELLFTAGG